MLQLLIGGATLALVGVVAVSWIRSYRKEPRPRPRWGGSRTSESSISFWGWPGAGGYLGGSGFDGFGDDCGGDGGDGGCD